MLTAPASAPVALSYARSSATRSPASLVWTPPSPAIRRVLVASTPMTVRPGWPSRDRFRPFSAGCFVISSGIELWVFWPDQIAGVHVVRGDPIVGWLDER